MGRPTASQRAIILPQASAAARSINKTRPSNRSGSFSVSHSSSRRWRAPEGIRSTPWRSSAKEVTLIKTRSSSTSTDPSYDPSIGAQLDPFRNDICIDQKCHRSGSRGLSLIRLTFRSDVRSGDAKKNSARLPLRRTFRSHSSAATTTTAVRRLRVIVCGVPPRARSTTSLNFAFASATVQIFAFMALTLPYRHVSQYSHIIYARLVQICTGRVARLFLVRGAASASSAAAFATGRRHHHRSRR